LRSRQQDLLLDADVSQQASTKLVVRSEIDGIAALGGFEQCVQPAVIRGQMVGDRIRAAPVERG
jgi:hypothetical protein